MTCVAMVASWDASSSQGGGSRSHPSLRSSFLLMYTLGGSGDNSRPWVAASRVGHPTEFGAPGYSLPWLQTFAERDSRIISLFPCFPTKWKFKNNEPWLGLGNDATLTAFYSPWKGWAVGAGGRRE